MAEINQGGVGAHCSTVNGIRLKLSGALIRSVGRSALDYYCNVYRIYVYYENALWEHFGLYTLTRNSFRWEQLPALSPILLVWGGTTTTSFSISFGLSLIPPAYNYFWEGRVPAITDKLFLASWPSPGNKDLWATFICVCICDLFVFVFYRAVRVGVFVCSFTVCVCTAHVYVFCVFVYCVCA